MARAKAFQLRTLNRAPDAAFFNRYYFQAEAYRKIDYAWLDAVGQFSLQLDGAINNTSLVLAFELQDSGKVLLFPGDAQVGSWLSWHDHQWKVKRGIKTETIAVEELLKNTFLYKVGHHGSHNATVKERGLELMTHPDLVAMIAEKEDSYNGILYQPLMERLKTMCKGRVIVSADVNHNPEKLLEVPPTELSADEWGTLQTRSRRRAALHRIHDSLAQLRQNCLRVSSRSRSSPSRRWVAFSTGPRRMT